MPRRSTTGPASISAPMSAARSPATTISTAFAPATTATAASSAACRPAPTGSSTRTGWSALEGQYSWLSGNVGAVFPGGYRLHQQPARPRLDHRPRRLHLGSGPALREGRLRLFRQQRDGDARRRADRVRDHQATTATATPSAPASNTCSRRTGRPRSSTSTTISAAPTSPHRRRWSPTGKLHHRRSRLQGGRELPHQLGRPGHRALLISRESNPTLRIRPAKCRPLSLCRTDNCARKAATIPNFVNPVPRYCYGHFFLRWLRGRRMTVGFGLGKVVWVSEAALGSERQPVRRFRRDRRHGDRDLGRRGLRAAAARRDA